MDAPTNPAEAALEGLIERLHARGRLRVWSLVVTVFGDAIVPRGGRVALSVLQELMARLRIEPGALRTAMSRLAADHWLTREKDGRNSYYRLAEQSRHAFDLATRRIYAAGPPLWDGTWLVAVAVGANGGRAGREQALRELGFASAGGNSWLRPFAGDGEIVDDLPGELLVVKGEALATPSDFGSLWPLAELAQAHGGLIEAFTPLARALAGGARLQPLEAMAARVLLDHAWRRIALRDPGLPAALLPPDWPGEEARAQVKKLYATLACPSEAWLDAMGLPGQVDAGKFRGRFGGIEVA